MRVEPTSIPGLLLIEPDCFRDPRGFLLESFQAERYREAGILDEFVQDNHSRSFKGVLRGLHFQVRRPQAQIVTVMHGRVFDVAVDLRAHSLTFGHWYGTELTDAGPRQLYMAPGFAHGFCVLSDVADLHYKVSRFFDGEDEAGLLWEDPDIGLPWPIDGPKRSDRDLRYPCLRQLSLDRLPHVGTSAAPTPAAGGNDN